MGDLVPCLRRGLVGFITALVLHWMSDSRGKRVAAPGIRRRGGARRMQEFHPVWFARWYSCLAVFLAVGLIASLGTHVLRSRVATFHVRSGTMIPTILVGDYVVAQKPGGATTSMRPCDVVVFRTPSRANEPEVDYVKRIVALPGDHVG
jgi:Signal peptidase, peptidase S26